ncbi:integrin alpha-PS3-like isoform X1 [Anastrepha obliqua]|uniref:integrin alpha-PS3-like isoform X1 n=1 Tax=Anastrepha obliqua TaxID=95512 RepID=UPI002409373A|nr:integrin alpha-PS3-like isoform X1 [Anastrepha obliqua]XP_054738539.1 integrin alpha-PS3-like isoform X1 [Anastrepha obliqua]XP_054738540.1 integrin alpha-PS3-like isoform X1 [Anastrepha obliqua]
MSTQYNNKSNKNRVLSNNRQFTYITLLFSIFALIWPADGFNFANQPNIAIPSPQHLKFFKPQTRSSYFGYTLVMRPTSIIVGAPRAQSTLPAQRNVNETGAIYRCTLSPVATCNPYVIDDRGNVTLEKDNPYTYDNEARDNQWLGAAMDGGTKDTDKLLICAPRFLSPTANDYLMNGICYWVQDTLNDNPINVQRISPLRLKSDQIKTFNNHRIYYYMLAEEGLSAHVTDNNEEFVIGAPGINTWKGSAIHVRKRFEEDPILSRRDTYERKRVARQLDFSGQYTLNTEDQPNDSYFGYAVGSGYFDSKEKNRLMYVATAPQANLQSGEAYLYKFSEDSTLKMTRVYVFRGLQFGEYFGYSLLTEDLNGDGLTDVVVSAPQHSTSGSFDDGAIYVFLNKGNFNFEQKLILSPATGKARFGTTLSRLGDINHDGFNDIAVGAPFAGNGSVFIYLGSNDGLRAQHSQRLNSPDSVVSKYGEHMFGHGLSKGADIDHNGFNDFAVGAPNAEAIFVYRAYPVVKIYATVKSQTREIKTDQNTFKITACYKITTTSTQIKDQDLAIRIVVDPQVKRVKLMQTRTNEISFNTTAGLQEQCRSFDCEVHSSVADIFKPIELEMHYDLINGVPKSEVFCDKCAAVDPTESKVYSEKIIFSTGCSSDICVADLEVKSHNLDHTYILGSSRTLSVTYDITNNGETAYLPQISITSSNRMPFAKIPGNCRIKDTDYLECDLNNGVAMARGAKDSFTVIFDVASISGKAMVLTAKVFSTGKEANEANNKVTDVITLGEFTEIDIVGIPKTPHVNLEKISNTTEIINNYEIKSVGPSTVGAMDVVFYIPVAYKVPGTTNTIQIIEMDKINMQAVYDAQLIGIDYYENNTQLIMNTIEISTSTHSTTTASKLKEHKKSTMTYEYNSFYDMPVESDSYDTEDTSNMSLRRRRRQAAAHTATKAQYARIVKAHELLGEELKGKLPVNRTIVFNCNDPEMTICVRAFMRVYNFNPEKPITVNMKYQVDLNEINQILIEPWEYFVILIGLDVKKIGDFNEKSLAIRKSIDYNIVSKHQLYGTPFWVYILAVLGGLLLLALMTYGMYKLGFFKRAKKEEMDALVHQGSTRPAQEDVEPEAENLNTERN